MAVVHEVHCSPVVHDHFKSQRNAKQVLVQHLMFICYSGRQAV